MKKKKTGSVRAILCQVFEFTEADLAANRNGEISEAQQKRMERTHHEDTQMVRIGILFFAAIGLVGSGLAAIDEGIPLLDMWAGLTITMIFVGVMFWIMLIYNRMRMHRTIHDSALHKVRGKIQLVREGNKPTSHYFCVGSQKFLILQREYFLLKQAEVANHDVVVYYTTRWRTILSIELA